MPWLRNWQRMAFECCGRSHAESDYALQRFTPGEGVPDVPWMAGFEVVGPYEPTGISVATRSRERIFTCQPKAPSEELPCAEQILSRLARLAFRRPTTETEIERMRKDAESHAEDDKRKYRLAEARNKAESQLVSAKAAVEQRQTQIDDLEASLKKVRAEVDQLLVRQTAVEADLFEIQREVSLTLEEVYRLEALLVEAERERYGLSPRP